VFAASQLGAGEAGNFSLSVPERNPAFRQIVGREFESHFVAGENANPIAAKPARKMGQHNTVVLQLHAEQTAWKLLENGTLYFYAVFLAHSTSLFERRLPVETYAELYAEWPAALVAAAGLSSIARFGARFAQ
jgi:hypothetical protein